MPQPDPGPLHRSAPVPDSAMRQDAPVTPDATAAEREAAARAALHDHKASCREPGCDTCILLAAAWRRALRYASLNHAPAQEAR